MRRLTALSLTLLLAACGGGGGDVPPDAAEPDADLTPTSEPLAPLPALVAAAGDWFMTSDVCAGCHAPAAGSKALLDQAGRDVSPSNLWRGSMMSMSARDPYYLAAFSRELERAAWPDVVEDLCTRCHAPQGARELANIGERLTFDALVGDAEGAGAHLARDGVSCTVCHAIPEAGLGDPAAYTGRFEVDGQRRMFGPHANPVTGPMLHHTGYLPTAAPHVTRSELCASCHTELTPVLDAGGNPTGRDVAQQATYLEWRSSSYADPEATVGCVSCHMPAVDEDGTPIATQIASHPEGLEERSPFGRHTLLGGNAWMLDLLAANAEWSGAGVPAEALAASAQATRGQLARAANVQVAGAERSGGMLSFRVQIENRTGHKLPTGLPGRRMWLHVRVLNAAGAVVFESGATDEAGRLVGPGGGRLDPPGALLPHRDLVTGSAEVAVWEAVLAGADGAPAHGLLDVQGFAKDDRILPAGWDAQSPSAALTAPQGTTGDATFTPGRDEVTYRVAAPAGALTVEARLLYQSVPPAAIEAFATVDTPAAVRFVQQAARTPPRPEVLATATQPVP